MYQLLSICLFISITIGCKNALFEKNSDMYFGGQIENPKEPFVTVKKGDEILDTLYLDATNNFHTRYNSCDEGLFTFLHGNELQFVLLENNDSIVINLNTLDFDESLVYFGRGAAKNEYLINQFLENEEEDRSFRTFFKLPPAEFKKTVENKKRTKEKKLEAFLEENEILSKRFENLAAANIHYPLYKKMEYYPMASEKIKTSEAFPELEEDFYAYRKLLNLNDPTLIGYYAYTDYLIHFLYNQSYKKLKSEQNTSLSIRSYFFKTVDEFIEIESFKNNLLMGNILHHLWKNNEQKDLDVLNLFLKISTDKKHKKKVRQLISDKTNLAKKDTIAFFEIISRDLQKKSLNQLIHKENNVLFFWSEKFMTTEFIKEKINYFSSKYPNIGFIGINTDKVPPEENGSNFYRLTKNSKGLQYNNSGYPRTILFSKEGIVFNSYTNIGAQNFDKHLREFQKK